MVERSGEEVGKVVGVGGGRVRKDGDRDEVRSG